MKSEKSALILSAIAALLIGGGGLTFALLTHSQAILLDGLLNLIYFLTALFTIQIARLITRPDDKYFPFGYSYFEPFINAIKGLLILGVSLLALFDAVTALFTGGRDIIIGPAIIYAILATLICISTALLLRRAYRSTHSPLIQADFENWTVDSAISAAVLLAFCAVPIINELGWTAAVAYVDPVLVTLVITISLGVPVRMAWRALSALLNKAPPAAVSEPVIANIKAALIDLPARNIYVRIVQPGRLLYAVVHILLPEKYNKLNIAEMDAIRHRIVAAIAKTQSQFDVDVIFTAEERFAAPAAGFIFPVASDHNRV